MKKYKCPYCGKSTFSVWRKLITGGMTSKGQACPECGRHAVHGMKANIFRIVIMVAVLVFIMINYFSSSPDMYLCMGVFASSLILSHIICVLLFELEENNRRDVR